MSSQFLSYRLPGSCQLPVNRSERARVVAPRLAHMDLGKNLVNLAFAPVRVGLAAAEVGIDVAGGALDLAKRTLDDVGAQTRPAVVHILGLDDTVARANRIAKVADGLLDEDAPLGRALAPDGPVDRLLRPGGLVDRVTAPGGLLDRLTAEGGGLERALEPGGLVDQLLERTAWSSDC